MENFTSSFSPTGTTTPTLYRNATVSMPTEPTTSLAIRLTLICFIFLLTVTGNSLAIYVISKNKAVRSEKNYYYGYYLMNLSASDLLVAVLCVPFTVVYYQTKVWKFGLAFCKIMPTLQVMAVSASIMTLTVITLERYKAIVRPLMPRSSLTRMKISLTCVWLWAILISIPTFISFKIVPTEKHFQCREVWVTKYRKAYTITLFLVNYAIPLLLLTIAYSKILYEMQKKTMIVASMGCRRLHKRFIRLMIILMISFFVCFLPNNVLFLLMDFGTIQNPEAFDLAMKYGHVLVWLNSCLNPFIYGTLDTYIKRGYKKAVGIGSNDSINTAHVTKYITEDYTIQVGRASSFLSRQGSRREDRVPYKIKGYLPVKPEELGTFAINNNGHATFHNGDKVLLYTETIAGNQRETEI